MIDMGFMDKSRYITPEQEQILKKEAIQKIKDNDTLSKLLTKHNGLDDDTISRNLCSFLSYLSDEEICHKCKGLSNCIKANQGMKKTMGFSSYSGNYENRLAPCSKMKKILEIDERYVKGRYKCSAMDLYQCYSDNINILKSSKNESTLDWKSRLFYDQLKSIKSMKKDNLNLGLFIRFRNENEAETDRIYKGLSFYSASLGINTYYANLSHLENDLMALAITEKPKLISDIKQTMLESECLFLSGILVGERRDYSIEYLMKDILSYRAKAGLLTYLASNASLDEILRRDFASAGGNASFMSSIYMMFRQKNI
jgi:hypothetical protein